MLDWFLDEIPIALSTFCIVVWSPYHMGQTTLIYTLRRLLVKNHWIKKKIPNPIKKYIYILHLWTMLPIKSNIKKKQTQKAKLWKILSFLILKWSRKSPVYDHWSCQLYLSFSYWRCTTHTTQIQVSTRGIWDSVFQ